MEEKKSEEYILENLSKLKFPFFKIPAFIRMRRMFKINVSKMWWLQRSQMCFTFVQ